MDELFGTGTQKQEMHLSELLETPIPQDTLMLNDATSMNLYASASGLCPRSAAYGKMQPWTNDPHETARELYYRIGNAAEDVVATRFKMMGVFLDRELRVEDPRLTVSGRIDFVINFGGKITLVELKTCGKLPTSPRKGHAAQLLTYMALTGIDDGIVWYISRSVSDWHNPLLHAPFRVEATDKALRSVVSSAATAKLWLERGAVPPKPSYMKKSHCAFCPLIPVCWEGEPKPFVDSVPDPIVVENETKLLVDSVMADRDKRRREMYRYYDVPVTQP